MSARDPVLQWPRCNRYAPCLDLFRGDIRFFFTLEMIARLVSARSLALLVVDPYFVIDVASLLPFYIEVGTF